MCGKILKYDEDPDCQDCGVPIPDGKQYGCEYCGNDFCEECMEQEADGMGFSGYRGEIDSGHPLEKHPEFTGGAYCPSCAVNMMANYDFDYNMETGEYEMPPEEDDEEMPVPPNQEVAVPENPFADMSDVELSQRLGALHGTNDPFFDELLSEATRRTMQGDPDQRANMSALIEGNLNEKLRRLGQPAIVPKPPAGDRLDYGFPEGFGDKFASADAFTSAWDVVKRERI